MRTLTFGELKRMSKEDLGKVKLTTYKGGKIRCWEYGIEDLEIKVTDIHTRVDFHTRNADPTLSVKTNKTLLDTRISSGANSGHFNWDYKLEVRGKSK